MKTMNFMYFANNFDYVQLETIFVVLGNAEHFKSKFNQAKGNNGTEKFLNWFMQLSHDNMETVVNWVSENYTAFKSWSNELR